MLLLPAAATVYLSFSAGGYTVAPLGLATLAFLVVLGAWTVLARRPFEGFGRGMALAAAALGAYAAWTLLSVLWSGAPLRGLIEFDRVLLYLLVLLLFGSLPRDTGRLRLMLWSLTAAMTAVCLAALATRLAPDVIPTGANLADNARLSFPLTYWNSLGLLAAAAMILSFHLTSSEREPRIAQVLGAAALPLLAATLVLTFSRGALLALAAGLLAYAAIGRPRGLVSGMIVAALAMGPVAVATYSASLLATQDPTTPAAVAQGHRLALIVLAAVVGAALVRLLLRSVVDPRVPGLRISRRLALGIGAGALVAVMAAAIVLQVPQRIAGQLTVTQSDSFTGEGTPIAEGGERLTQAGDSQRPFFWSVALGSFAASPLLGEGAGTYEVIWNQERPTPLVVLDAHSVYIEALGELGAVGGLLLLVAIVTPLAGAVRRAHGPERALYAAAFAAMLAWALRAAIDWDWEMPAVSLWFFAVGGMALAALPRARRAPSRASRIVVVAALGVLSIVPLALMLSQQRLDRAFSAFRVENCNTAVLESLAARGVLPLRPEPYEVVGYCEARAGRFDAAAAAMERAIDSDPEEWRYHYGLALVRGAAGEDPTSPELEEAERLNPAGALVQTAIKRFGNAAGDPERLRLAALNSYLPPDLRPLPGESR